MLRKSTFNKVMTGLKRFQSQHEDDRKKNPERSPMSWGSQIRGLVERVCREDHHPFTKNTPDEVIKYLVEKKVLLPYVGDYTFYQDAPLPTAEQITQQVRNILADAK